MWTPYVGEIATTVVGLNNASDCYAENIDVNVNTAHCAALALRGIPRVIFLILRHFLILCQNVCKHYFKYSVT